MYFCDVWDWDAPGYLKYPVFLISLIYHQINFISHETKPTELVYLPERHVGMDSECCCRHRSEPNAANVGHTGASLHDDEAHELNIPIISEDEFIKQFAE